MIDDNLKPYLIEINVNPALSLETKIQKDIIPKVLEKTIRVILKINKKIENI